MAGPYHDENTRSRPISEVKHRRAGIVLGWGTAWELPVTCFFSIGFESRITFWTSGTFQRVFQTRSNLSLGQKNPQKNAENRQNRPKSAVSGCPVPPERAGRSGSNFREASSVQRGSRVPSFEFTAPLVGSESGAKSALRGTFRSFITGLYAGSAG